MTEADDKTRIAQIVLDDPSFKIRNPDIDYERRIAISDLLEGNFFQPKDAPTGPYHLYLALAERGFVFDLRDSDDAPCAQITLSLSPFRRIIRDYIMVCENYYTAIRTAKPDRLEAIDESRRTLHSEGATILRDKLAPYAVLDENTARRFFTLISVLQMRS